MTINLGSGREVTIGELARLISQLIGRPAVVENDEERVRPEKSEVQRLLADNTLARNVLGWEPVISLEEGLKYTVDWMKKHPERFRSDVYTI
jgi:dTDP-glucose 4,6-dehydratase